MQCCNPGKQFSTLNFLSFPPFFCSFLCSYAGDQTYFDEIKQFYYRDEFSHQVQEWNKQRTLAIERALQQFLYPQMAKELKNKLIAEAKENIIKVSLKCFPCDIGCFSTGHSKTRTVPHELLEHRVLFYFPSTWGGWNGHSNDRKSGSITVCLYHP